MESVSKLDKPEKESKTKRFFFFNMSQGKVSITVLRKRESETLIIAILKKRENRYRD